MHYEGELQHDLKEGRGKIMLENGEWFEGEFHDDRINGEGRFVNLEGEVIIGRWTDNIMVEEYVNWLKGVISELIDFVFICFILLYVSMFHEAIKIQKNK